VAPAWGARPAAGEDAFGHLVLTKFGIQELFSNLQLNGWSPRFMLGFETFLFLGPGLAMMVDLLHLATFGQLSITGAFKAVQLLSFLTLPLAMAFLTASFGLGRRAAGLAAVLTLTVNSPFGGAGTQGLFGVGLIPHQVGATFFALALGGLVRIVRTPRLRWALFTALSLAVLVVTHARSLATLAVVFLIVLALRAVERWGEGAVRSQTWRWRRRIRQEVSAALDQAGFARTGDDEPSGTSSGGSDLEGLDLAPPEPAPPVLGRRSVELGLLAAVVALGLSAFFAFPVLAHRSLQGPLAGWEAIPIGRRLSEAARGDYLFRPPVGYLVGVGMVLSLLRLRRQPSFTLVVAGTPLVYLAVAHWSDRQWPGNLVTYQLPVRGLGYAALLAVLPLAWVLARASTANGGTSLLALIAAAGLVLVPMGRWRDEVRQAPDPVPPMQEAAGILRAAVPEGARFAVERDYPDEIARTGIINPDRWLAWASGRNVLNVFSIESTIASGLAFETERFDEKGPGEVADALGRLGVSHVVTVSPATADRFRSSPRFRTVWVEAPMGIFALLPVAGRPDPVSLLATDAPASATLERAATNELQIRFQAREATRATVATAWSPKWDARLDGAPVDIGRTTDGLIAVSLPAGDHELELTFGPDAWDRLGQLSTLVTVLLLGAWVLRRRSVRRRSPSGSDGGAPAS